MTSSTKIHRTYLPLTLFSLGLVMIPALVVASIRATPSPDPVRDKPQLVETYGKLPLSFEANKGQTDPQVKFMARGHGYSLFLTPNEAVLALQSREASGVRREAESNSSLVPRPPSREYEPTVLRMQLEGANPKPEVTALDELPGRVNYFIGNDQKQWRTNVPTYAKVKYRDVYPGIDLVYYGNQRQLEYDLVVAPGADPGQIKLVLQGTQDIGMDPQGDLILGADGGEFRLRKPLVYQNINGTKQLIAATYVLQKSSDHELRTSNLAHQIVSGQVGIQVARYDATKPLIIDPVLDYSTHLGGNNTHDGGQDSPAAVAVDAAGSAYVFGVTQSVSFPTAGAFQPALAGSFEFFVSKLNAAGTALVYSTYLGGSGGEVHAGDIAVDGSGSAYITGSTASNNYPTTPGAYQSTLGNVFDNNVSDAVVTKLNATGSALVYSTYLGGSNGDVGFGIAVDLTGNAYVVGGTDSLFPTTPGAFQTAFGGFVDAFVTKLNPTGTALVYSSLLGGSNREFAQDVAVDSSGNAYVTGFSESTNFPTTPGAFQTTCPTCAFVNGDAFVAKVNPTGSALVYSTYLGGSSGEDEGRGIALGASGSVYVAGRTGSSNFPTTAGAFQTTFGGGSSDAFVAQLNSTGTALVYSTLLGGSGFDFGLEMALDSAGQTYVIGLTGSTNFPTTTGAIQATFGGGSEDAFVAKLNPTGTALVYSTYLGGSGGGVDRAWDIAVDAAGAAYVVGVTRSADFPTTAGAFQTVFGGGLHDVFVAKIADVVPFAGFTAKVEIELHPLSNDDEFEVKATFTPGTGSNGIAPLTEAVSFQVGPFSTTIPAGSFKQDKKGRFKFEGVINGVALEAVIRPLGLGSFEFKAEGKGVELTGTVNPVTVALTIGNDGGSTTVTAEFD